MKQTVARVAAGLLAAMLLLLVAPSARAGGDFVDDLAVGDGALLALSNDGAHSTLVRIDQRSSCRAGRLDLPAFPMLLSASREASGWPR